MRMMLAVLAGAAIVLLGAAGPVTAQEAAAQEELFDTASAAEAMERGVHLLGSRNYDGAIDALEESVGIAPTAESLYLLGYAYYMKGRSGDEESRQLAMENFRQAYAMNPNFSPNRFVTPEIMTAPQPPSPAQDATPAAAAPASALEPGAAVPPAAPPAQPGR